MRSGGNTKPSATSLPLPREWETLPTPPPPHPPNESWIWVSWWSKGIFFFLFPQKTVTIESIYKAEICLLKNFFLEWTYPQPGSSHTFCCFCCCFCSGNSAQHHGKSCWCHLTSCLPPLCYSLSDPSIHLPLTSSPSLCPSSLRSQHTILPNCFRSEGGTPKNFRQTIHTKPASWVCIIFKEANRNIQSCFYTSAQEI
jgi:hypothetical protein